MCWIWTNYNRTSFRHPNWLSYEAISSTRTLSHLCTATTISSFFYCSDFISNIAFVSRHDCSSKKFCTGNQMCLHRRIFQSSNWKLVLVEFECTTTEFHSDALNNSAKPWDQPSTQSKANFVQLLQFHLYSLLRFHVVYCLRQLPSLF